MVVKGAAKHAVEDRLSFCLQTFLGQIIELLEQFSGPLAMSEPRTEQQEEERGGRAVRDPARGGLGKSWLEVSKSHFAL